MIEFVNLLEKIGDILKIEMSVFGFSFSYYHVYMFGFLSLIAGYFIGKSHK